MHTRTNQCGITWGQLYQVGRLPFFVSYIKAYSGGALARKSAIVRQEIYLAVTGQ